MATIYSFLFFRAREARRHSAFFTLLQSEALLLPVVFFFLGAPFDSPSCVCSYGLVVTYSPGVVFRVCPESRSSFMFVFQGVFSQGPTSRCPCCKDSVRWLAESSFLPRDPLRPRLRIFHLTTRYIDRKVCNFVLSVRVFYTFL